MKNNKIHDAVNHPKHYTNSSLECIQVMEMTFGIDSTYDYCLMNAFKYMWRHKEKNGFEDLKKARWYVNHAIELKPDGFLHSNVDRLLRGLEKEIAKDVDFIKANPALKTNPEESLEELFMAHSPIAEYFETLVQSALWADSLSIEDPTPVLNIRRFTDPGPHDPKVHHYTQGWASILNDLKRS